MAHLTTRSRPDRQSGSANLRSQNSARSKRLDNINLVVLSTQITAWGVCLWSLPRVEGIFPKTLIVVLFCFMMQGIFSMMHECFHGHGHRNNTLNTLMCWLASTIFGASATLIRINHLGHHVRNRTRAELVDFVEADESRAKKTCAYYFAICGGIWLASFVASILLLLVPAKWLIQLQTRGEANTYAAAFADFQAADFKQIRLEVLAGLGFWVLAWWALNLEWQSMAVLYVAFAVSWSSLQWIYHVRTPLHVIEGTYNLRAPFPVRYLFLNFNYNLTHHREPGIRWQHLHSASNLQETRPFWRSWLAILKPPAPMPADRIILKTYY